MNFTFVYLVLMFITLPVMVIQIRYMLYTKKYSNRDAKLSLLYREMLPHDLAIMGMTFAFAASMIAYRSRLIIGASNFQVLFLMLSFIPLFFISAISIIEKQWLRILLGIAAYLVGSLGFGYIILQLS